jgi:hypothetical protein
MCTQACVFVYQIVALPQKHKGGNEISEREQRLSAESGNKYHHDCHPMTVHEQTVFNKVQK